MQLTLKELQDKIANKSAKVAVIGLGYVGLPVACEFARVNFDVLGVELRPERVEKINRGISPIDGDEPGLNKLLIEAVQTGRLRATDNYQELCERDVILIDVETPVDEDHIPRYDALRSVLESLGPVLKYGALVIIESTISPGTMNAVVKPLLEKSSGGRLNENFFLGNCPERVMPGKLLSNLRGLSRVVGGMTPETAEAMVSLYCHIVQADLDPVNCVTAELVKTVENAYRDVQIAFANEIALICEEVGGDVWRVRDLVNKSPYRHMHLPGAGVGGHCIPKDPWLLYFSVKDKDVPVRIIPAARSVNDSMPLHMVQMIEKALVPTGRNLSGARVLVLGYAYLEDSDDTRNSPSESLVRHLKNEGAEVVIHDPYVSEYQGDWQVLAKNCDVAVLMVKHQSYLDMDLKKLATVMRTPLLVDGRNALDAKQASLAGINYRAIGQK
jgi:UDP-N-acetyl-D-mannosaminuronic acid dehydrogenase